MKFVAIRTKQFVHDPPGKARAGQDHGLLHYHADGDFVVLGQGIVSAHHEHESVSEDGPNLEHRHFHGERDDPHIDRPAVQPLQNLVTEVPVNAHLHRWIKSQILGENIGQDIKAGGLVRAEREHTSRIIPVVGDGAQGFIAQA